MVNYTSRQFAPICFFFGPDLDCGNSRSNQCLVGPHPGTAFGWGISHLELKDHISMLR
jgi:hypothetical protein